MKEELISFETAKLAKEKGFNEDVYNGYNSKRELSKTHRTPLRYNDDWKDGIYYSAPTQSLLQKWLREEHNIHVQAHPILNNKWSFSTYNINNKSLLYGQGKGYIGKKFERETYEEALEKGLQEALTLIDKE